MITIKLDVEMERKLELIRKKKSVSKTALVKEVLEQYIQREIGKLSAYELGEDLFVIEEGGDHGCSRNHKKEIKSRLQGKFPH